MNQSPLIHILEGCLNSNTVQQAQKKLVQYSNNPTFVSQLLQLIPNSPNNIVTLIMSTLKNYCSQKYNNPITGSISDNQKQILRDNLFNLLYQINNNNQAVNLYKEVVYIVISIDFQKYNNVFYNLLRDDLQNSIQASIYFSRQVARFYQWLNGNQRQPLQRFINDFFPKLEELVQKIMSDYNEITKKLLTQLLQMFYSAFHIQVPNYLRNFSNIDKWLLYIKTILKAPIDNYPQNHIQVSRIFVKFLSFYCKDGIDGKQWKGWGKQFRSKYSLNLYTQIIQILINPIANEQVMANILSCLCSIVNNPDLCYMLEENHVYQIIYKYLLPFMQSTNQDNLYFKNDGLEYIRRNQDLTCHPYRRVSLDLIKCIAQRIHYGNKSQTIKFVQYSSIVLNINNNNNNNNNNSTDKQKQVILITLSQLAPLIMKNNYLRQNFENLVVQYFIPLLKYSNNIIISQTLKLLSIFLKFASLSTSTVQQLMRIFYDKMCQQCIVIKYHAILAFTQLLDNKQALQTARPHFQNILSIYVKLLQVLQHQSLILSLQSIIESFSSEIINVAYDLSNHLFNLFYSLHNKQNDNNDNNNNNNNNNDDYQNQNNQANATLSTIKQILECPLKQQIYYQISQKVMILLQNLCSQYDKYFEQILNILNTLVYKSNNIINYQFPYLLCRKLLQGNNQILINCNNKQFINIISQADKADVQYSQVLISIIKNIIQKMPINILKQYKYSNNPQLMLCLIQNKKLDNTQLCKLNTSQIDSQWSLILQSYTSIIYGIGQICNIKQLKMLNGISLYPWIQYKFDIQVIKRFMLTLQDQQANDQYYQQNTAQMLQQFANQNQDQDDQADYYISDGGNYSYMYDSPFDSTKDLNIMLNKIRTLNPNQFRFIFQNIGNKYANKLENLLKQQ